MSRIQRLDCCQCVVIRGFGMNGSHRHLQPLGLVAPASARRWCYYGTCPEDFVPQQFSTQHVDMDICELSLLSCSTLACCIHEPQPLLGRPPRKWCTRMRPGTMFAAVYMLHVALPSP
ncbi:unnamed protein product [Polarella glacialis]|uniref:Uncharacterized protein n=1 Tax=Polarella glacialis TaxID=89957 RepID=A0A813KIP8_POLGL|nr:unnamed protein product [Polarella glacialis]